METQGGSGRVKEGQKGSKRIKKDQGGSIIIVNYLIVLNKTKLGLHTSA